MKRTRSVIAVSLISLSLSLANAAQAQKWADLSMTVVLDGDVPIPKQINAAFAPICGARKILSEALVVDEVTKEIANVVFMIDSRKTKLREDQFHPDLQKVPQNKPTLDNLRCAFVPHILALRAGQTLVTRNSDPTVHSNTFNFFKNNPLNPMIPVGGDKEVVTEAEEPGPVKVECSIYPWMSGWVIVAGHPYVGISDSAGRIKIEKLPAGIELHFRLWHESQNKSIDQVTLAGKSATWPKGTVRLTLKEGENDLGVLSIKPDRFKE